MPELREVFEMVTKQTEPDTGSWKEQEQRQRRTARNKRVGAMAVAAAIAVVLVTITWVSRSGKGDTGVATNPPGVKTTKAPVHSLSPSEQDVEIVNLQGHPLTAITGVPDDAYGLSLSPDGSRLAFVTAKGQSGTVLAWNGNDGKGMHVIPTPGVVVAPFPAAGPSWSPAGDRLVFEGSVGGGNNDLYVVNIDGSGLLRLTDDPAYDQYPQWSPDGSTIVYDNSGSQTDTTDPQYSKTAEIWTVPADGSGAPTRLTKNGGSDNAPSYSPDGSEIAYFSEGQLWVMASDGTDQHRLLSHGGFTPRWSPDGTKIAYTTYDASYRPLASFPGQDRDTPLVIVNVVDVRTGKHHTVGDVGMATDLNAPVWVDNSTLLIRRVGYP